MNNNLIRKLNQNLTNNSFYHIAKNSFYILVFISANIALVKLSSAVGLHFYFINLDISKNVIIAIVSQTQLMASIGLTISANKKTYLLAVLLNICSLILALGAIILGNNLNAIPGLVVPACTIIVITIIENYVRNINKNIAKVTKQKEELLLMYKADELAKKQLREKNKQLIEYNLLMRANEKKLDTLAYYDSLTLLPNRRFIIDTIENYCFFASENNTSFALVIINLDDFKRINDYSGHSIGDGIIKIISERLKTQIYCDDVLGNIGGDEFALIIRRELCQADILSYLERLKSSLNNTITLEQKQYYVTACFGVAVFPSDGINSGELLNNADIALNKAKKGGKNIISEFSSEIRDEILQKITLENNLKSANLNNEFSLVYQPQYNSETKALRGFEVLLRWHSPELGFVSPAKFIPIAEASGEIIRIGEWILRTSLKKFKNIMQKYNIKVMLSVNISVVQIVEPSFIEMVKRVLDETGYDSRYLEFEVTESVFISSTDYVIGILNKLNDMGINIALDDFGTGYASLSYLQLLPIDTLKIDKAFIDSISDENMKHQIVGSIISLAHQLGYSVVAEGVENCEQYMYLLNQNCDYIQGYLLGHPINEQQLNELLSSFNRISNYKLCVNA